MLNGAKTPSAKSDRKLASPKSLRSGSKMKNKSFEKWKKGNKSFGSHITYKLAQKKNEALLGPGSYHTCYPPETCTCTVKDPATGHYYKVNDRETFMNDYSSKKGTFPAQQRSMNDSYLKQQVNFFFFNWLIIKENLPGPGYYNLRPARFDI